jgi:uncharacterized protein (TIGR03437 family)
VLTPASLGTIYIPAGTSGSVQSVQAYNAGDGTLILSTTTSASWLASAVGSAVPCPSNLSLICQPILVSLNTSSLASGTYSGNVMVTAANATDSPLTIPVQVVIGSIPAAVTLYADPGGSASAAVYPRSPVSGVSATSSGGNWLTFGSPGGAFNFGSAYTITATAQAGMATGTYTGTVTITGSSYAPDNQVVAVTMVVTSSPIVAMPVASAVLLGYQGGPKAYATITLNNVGQGLLALTSAAASSSTTGFLTASVASSNSVSVTADPSQLAPGLYTGTVTVTSNAANSAGVSIPVSFNVASAGAPSISQGGIVNISTYSGDPAAQGDIIAVFGQQFTAAGTFYTNQGPPPLATMLGNVQVLVNGVPAPLYYVSPQQINLQMPYTAGSGQVTTVQVISGSTAGNTRSVPVSAIEPHLLIWPSNVAVGNYAVVVNSDGSLSMPGTGTYGSFKTRPSLPGETVTVYCIGFGQTSPTAVAGQAASSSQLMVNSNVAVNVGSAAPIAPAFAGLTPTAVSLYQVNVTLPSATVLSGSSPVPLSVTVDGAASNIGNIAIAP